MSGSSLEEQDLRYSVSGSFGITSDRRSSKTRIEIRDQPGSAR
jgi:hypothetical protein